MSYRQHQIIGYKKACPETIRLAVKEFDEAYAVMRWVGSVIGFDEYVVIESPLVAVRLLFFLFSFAQIVLAIALFLHLFVLL